MPYLQLSFTIAETQAERFETALFEAGASSITLLDAADVPILEPLPGCTPLWPSIRLQALFDIQIDASELQQRLRVLLDDYPEALCEVIADRLWEREWLKDFRPMRFGERLWICPGGEIPPEAASGCVIELDPGLAFGTGTHPTTALCLQWLDCAPLQNQFVIDYGCGSGILAIAALRLGAAQALAVDIDPQALIATRTNAVRNRVSNRLIVDEVAATVNRHTSLLLANILAEPLDALAENFSRMVMPGGSVVLSGLLHSQAQTLVSRYSAWFDMSPPAVLGDWVRLVGVRRP